MQPGDLPEGGAATGGACEPVVGGLAQVRTRRPIWLAGIAAMVAFLALYGLWTRLSSAGGDSPTDAGELIPAATATGTSLAAVGRTAGLDEPCTAWLVDVGAADLDPAYAVTGGRCVGATDPAVVLADSRPSGASVSFRAFAPLNGSVASERVEVPIDSVAWASSRGTDLAILRLGATYADLSGQGVTPIRPVDPAPADTQILIAGVPVEGVDPGEQYLRGSRCQAGPATDVLQGSWLGHDLGSAACPGILGGSRGSPVLNEAGEAVGMVATTTIGAPEGQDCTSRRPCEVSAEGQVRMAGDRSYLVPVGLLAPCFSEGVLTLGDQCGLEDPTTVVPARADAAAARPGETITIRARGVADPDSVRVKHGELGEVDCRSPGRWRRADASAADDPDARSSGADGGWVHRLSLPEDERRLLVCVGSADQPTEIVVAADDTPPEPSLITLLQTPVQGGVRVEPVLDPPELVRFRWVSSPARDVDCSQAEGYVAYPGTPATIQGPDLPRVVCIIGIDAAGNRSDPAARIVE